MITRTAPGLRPRPSLLASFRIQARVVGALILRELHTRYGRENIGYLWMVGEPLLLATVIGLMHGAQGHTAYAPDVQPLPFGVLGYTTFILFRGIVNRSEGGLEANGPLLYHRQVTVFDITIARVLLEFAGVFLTMVLLMTLFIGMGYAEPPVRPLVVIGAWMLMLFYGLGHATLIAAISYDNRTVGRLVHPYSYFMVFLSGAFTPIHWLPHSFQSILTWIPIAGIFELVRYGWFRSFNLDYFYPLYVCGFTLILNWVGLMCLASVRNKIHLP